MGIFKKEKPETESGFSLIDAMEINAQKGEKSHIQPRSTTFTAEEMGEEKIFTVATPPAKKQNDDKKPEPVSKKTTANDTKTEQKSKPELSYEPKEDTTPDINDTLLRKCKVYTIDENGAQSVNSIPLYRLESFADILRKNGEQSIERLSKQYNIKISDIEKEEPKEPPKKQEIKIPESFKKQYTITDIFNIINPKKQPEKTEDTAELIGNNVISDIDPSSYSGTFNKTKPFIASTISSKSVEKSITATLPTEISLSLEKSNAQAESASIADESNITPDYTPAREFEEKSQRKELIRSLNIKKKNYFINLTALFFMGLLYTILSAILASSVTGVLITSVLSVIVVMAAFALNIDCLDSFKFIRQSKGEADVLYTLCSAGALLSVALGLKDGYSTVGLSLCFVILSFIRSLFYLRHTVLTVKVFKKASNDKPKQGINLVTQKNIIGALAKNYVQGEPNVAMNVNCNFVKDFFKNTEQYENTNGGLKYIGLIGGIIFVLTAIICGCLSQSITNGFCLATQLTFLLCSPLLYGIKFGILDNANRRLSPNGAIIGTKGAINLNKTKCVTINAGDIFPSGSITIRNLTPLSDNDMVDTILRATAVTKATNSPLYPVFKSIAESHNIYEYPTCEYEKYEGTLGVSGWCKGENIFVGNGAMLRVRNIVNISYCDERKSLDSNGFPVFVAIGNRAVLMLDVSYNVNESIKNTLQTLCKYGVTILLDSCDPNINEQMVTDKFGLEHDCVKEIDTTGKTICDGELHKNKVALDGIYTGRNLNSISVILSGLKAVKNIKTARITYIILSALCGMMMLISGISSGGMISAIWSALYMIINFIISLRL